MTMAREGGGMDARLLRLEQELAGLRERVAEVQQDEIRNQGETSSLGERVRELENRAVGLGSEVGMLTRNYEEVQTLRERIGRFQSALAEARESTEVELRQLRQELGSERESGGEALRRLEGVEHSASDLRTRFGAYDDALQRVNGEASDVLMRLSQMDSALEAHSARIGANNDALRRSATAARATDSHVESVERQTTSIAERLDLAMQGVRRVNELADTWEGLSDAVEGMKGRLDDAVHYLEEARSLASAAQRQYETLAERIGDVDRQLEQLRVRDAHRERELASVSDQVGQVVTETSGEQDRFVALQEKIRRRQIDDLEQEIRELKAYVRVRSDV